MASLYKDRKSPFWYIKFKDASGTWRSESTKYRHGIATETRKAQEKRAERTLEEARRGKRRDAWATWVPDYLASRYRAPVTLRRAKNAWASLNAYFIEKRIYAPQNLIYRDCVEYLPWRTKKAAHNTALLELKILGVICEEAKRRSMITVNPALKLGIARERGREKPELSDDDIIKIRTALKSEPVWMSHAFEIALHQGCRLSETPLLIADVDLVKMLVHFRRTKGDKPFTVPIHPALQVRFRNLLENADKRERIFELPSGAAREFHRFFKKLSIPGVSFHSTRVTVASRLARSGYSIAKAMRLLNHGSELIHRQYQRLQAEDVADAYPLLRFPTDTGSNETQDEQPANPGRH